MQIPIEQLLNLPDTQALDLEITESKIKCDIELTHGSLYRAKNDVELWS